MEKKRKIDGECRKFKDQWNIQYFVIESSNKALCLICNESIAVLKEYNMKRHYETKHSQNYSKYTGIVRTEKFEALKRGLKSQQSLFTKVKTEQEAATRASFRVALEIAKRGKPFTDGEMIKECIIAVVEEMCPEKVNLLKTVSMSANTVARSVENIAENISSQLFDKNGHVEWFSLALDESTDVSDTAQVLIYIRGVDKSYEVHEELLDMYSIHGTTTGTDIFKGVEMAINKKNLRWKNLKCITTDGGKNMSGKDKGVVALVSKAVENDGGSKPLVLHCIIHQQSLCGKCLDISDVLKPVISTVNFIRSFGLNHQQFRQFIAEIEKQTYLIILPYAGLVVGKSFNAFLNFEHHTTETEFPIDFAIETLSASKINFDTRFSDFDAIANQIKIFQNPFDADIETLAPELQMEMIDLQCSDIIKNKYENSSLLEFYKSLPLTQFDNLHKFARGLFSVFVSRQDDHNEGDHNEEGKKPVQIEATKSKDGGTSPPVQQNDQHEIQTQIEQMLQHRIIAPSVSPYASPITLVTKRDKTKRFCIDYRKLNEIIAPDVHPLPLIEIILDKLSKAKYYSSVDIASAYWQVEIEPNSRTYAPQTRNLDTINSIKPPTNQKTLQSFLRAVNVYNKFIPDYARLRAPLNRLLKKDVKWNWDPDCQQAFTTLKESLTSKPVLHFHALRTHERNYTVSELECLAIVESVDKFRIYLTGIEFTIYTDHQALQCIKTIKNPSGRLFRWSLRLSTYNYEIHYLKGSQQYEADLLSRNPFVGFISTDIIKQHQPTASPFNIDTNGLHTITRKGVTKIIIPETLQHTLMNKVHQEYNHPGISQMTRIITTQYYWKGISKSIEKFVRSCHTCQIIKRPKGKPYGALGQIPPPQQPFDLISIDTIAGFSKYGHSKTYLHVIVDHLMRYAWTFPSKSTSTLTYSQTLKNVLHQGSPKRLLSDRAPAFTSEKFRKFIITHGIQPLLTTSNNPQANGLIERLNATITGKLRLAYLENPKASWTQLVKRVTQTYNNTPHSVTSFPPTYLMFNVIPPDIRTHLNPYPEINTAREIASSRTQNKHKNDKETFD
ncbi:EPM2AIP1 [Cordylochernes scorpioides]|uniref:EPM2AIP1 n=1 Tax=Cordylochernes scorpioides TaxID=51811 RepID=A0ABY6LP67_9ARAC|nr:EPM2AIP1 [Cordylochernes scorpioides]